jgi:predicted DNA-binding transcriptional regulator YafY
MPVDKKVHSRLHFLDKLFREQEGITYNQIKSRLEDNGYPVTIRTIQKDIDVLKAEYGAVFQTSRFGHQIQIRYKDITRSIFAPLSTSEHVREVKKRLEKELYYPAFLLSASILEHIADDNPIRQFIDAVDFDENAELSGVEYFPYLLRAIINRQCVTFTYKPFKSEERIVTVSPYLLKLYNQRWFLVCKTFEDGPFYIDALDRIKGKIVVNEDVSFINADYSYIRQCLEDTIGTTDAFNDDVPVENITLSVASDYFPYLDTKPFPHQESRIEGEQHLVSFRAKINRELISRILYLGTRVEVLSPEYLREEILLKIKELSDMYTITTK